MATKFEDPLDVKNEIGEKDGEDQQANTDDRQPRQSEYDVR